MTKFLLLFVLTILFFSCQESILTEKHKDNIEKILSGEIPYAREAIKLKFEKKNDVVIGIPHINEYLYSCVISKMGQLNIGLVFNNKAINDYNIEALHDTTHVHIVRWQFENEKNAQLFYDISRKFNCPTSVEHSFLERGSSEYFIVGRYLYIVESYNYVSTQVVSNELKGFLMFKRELIYNGVNLDSIHLYRY
jgi:hypothetical protein